MLFCHMTMHGAAVYCQDIVVMETKPTHGDGVLCLMELLSVLPVFCQRKYMDTSPK